MIHETCSIDACSLSVAVRISTVRAGCLVEDNHYCSGHADELIDRLLLPGRVEKGPQGPVLDDCEVSIEKVICDNRDEVPCVVVLGECNGGGKVAIQTGKFEAWSLAWEVRRESTKSPSTHHAMVAAIRALCGDVQQVTIDDEDGGVFNSRLTIKSDPAPISIVIRPSDALILSVICNARIVVAERVWRKLSSS